MAIVRSQSVVTTVPAGLNVPSVEDEIRNIRPAQSTLLTLLMGLNKVQVDNRKFMINEQEIDASYITLSAKSGNDLTASAADASFVRVGMTLVLNSAVSCLVTAVNYTMGIISVDDATGIGSTDVLLLGSTGAEELSARPTVVSRVPVQIDNYVETRRDAYGQSRFVDTQKTYGGARAPINREICMWEHKRFIDRGLWFGKKALTTQGGSALYKTNGVFQSITTNVRTFSGNAVTWDKIRANITTDTRFSLSPDLWLCLPRVGLEYVEKIVRNKTQPITYTTAAGIKVGEIGMGNKTLKLFVIDHFEQGLNDTWVMLDPSMIEIVTCRDQKTGTRQWMLEKTEQQDPGQDGEIGTLTTDFGLRLHNEKAHAIWKGAQSAS